MPLSERFRRLGKIAIIAWFGFLIFSVVFYLSLPYARFQGVLASRLATYGYEMEAKHAGPSLGLGMSLEEVTLVSRPEGATKPTRILIEKATLGWSLLSYLWGSRSYSLSAHTLPTPSNPALRGGPRSRIQSLCPDTRSRRNRRAGAGQASGSHRRIRALPSAVQFTSRSAPS